MWEDQERQYVETARVGRLGTADGDGRPNVVPVCFAFDDEQIVSPVDEKPQRVSPRDLRRCRDVEENPRVALVVDHYDEDWSRLGWVQVRGTATLVAPGEPQPHHSSAVRALRRKYDQYGDHDLSDRPLLRFAPESVRSWGRLERPNGDDVSP